MKCVIFSEMIRKSFAENQRKYRERKKEKGRWTNLCLADSDIRVLDTFGDKSSLQQKIIDCAIRYKQFRLLMNKLWKDIDIYKRETNKLVNHIRFIIKELNKSIPTIVIDKIQKNNSRKNMVKISKKHVCSDYRIYAKRHSKVINKSKKIKIFIPFYLDNLLLKGKLRGNPSLLLRYAIRWIDINISFRSEVIEYIDRFQLERLIFKRLDSVDSQKLNQTIKIPNLKKWADEI